jgi:DNA-binding winged helix-turn-helix (wHTH) protein
MSTVSASAPLGISVHTRRGWASVGGEQRKLKPASVQTLRALSELGGEATRSQLTRQLWSDETGVADPDADNNRLDKRIGRLRTELGDDKAAPHFIEVVEASTGFETVFRLKTQVTFDDRAWPFETVEAQMGNAARRGEATVAGVRIVVMLTLFATQIVLVVTSPDAVTRDANWRLLAVAVAGIAYALFVRYVVDVRYRPYLAWMTTFVDAALLTIANVYASAVLLHQPDAITKWPSLLALYFVIVISAGLRLSTRLTWIAGLTCFSLFALSAAIAVALTPERAAGYRALSSASLDWVLTAVFGLFILLATWCVVALVALVSESRESLGSEP